MLGNFGKMMKVATEMQAKLPEVQQRLAGAEHCAEAGGGAVVATVNGRMQLVKLTIEEGVLADEAMDAEMLADLVKAAVSAAQEQAAAAAEEAVKKLTGGIDIPGGLRGLLG